MILLIILLIVLLPYFTAIMKDLKQIRREERQWARLKQIRDAYEQIKDESVPAELRLKILRDLLQ